MSSRRKGKGLTGWPIRMKTLRCGQRRNRLCCGALLALALVSTLGCSATATRLGLRVRLDSVPVTAVSASLVNKRGGSMVSALGPGQSAQLVVVARTRDEQQFATVGSGHGKVALDNYRIEAAVIQVSKSGTVSLSSGSLAVQAPMEELPWSIRPPAHSALRGPVAEAPMAATVVTAATGRTAPREGRFISGYGWNPARHRCCKSREAAEAVSPSIS